MKTFQQIFEEYFLPAEECEVEEGISLADIAAAEALLFGADSPTNGVYPDPSHYVLLTDQIYKPMGLFMFVDTDPSWYKRLKDADQQIILPGTQERFNERGIPVIELATGRDIIEKVEEIFNY